MRTRFWRFVMRKMFKGRRPSVQQHREQDARLARWVKRVPHKPKVEQAYLDGMRLTWVRPPNAAPDKVILYLHGGGYVAGLIDTHLMLCIPMAQTMKVNMLLPEYRLAPESPFPAALEDSLKVYRWLLGRGYQSANIIIAGDSAGGGLSVATALALRDDHEPLPAALLCISPWVDLTHSGQSHLANAEADVVLDATLLKEWALCYAGQARLGDPLVSPVFADLRGLPPILIQVGDEEILLDDSRMLADKARADGVDVSLRIWKGMWHVWQSMGGLVRESGLAFEEMDRFVRDAYQKR